MFLFGNHHGLSLMAYITLDGACSTSHLPGFPFLSRFVLLECAAHDPTKLRVKVNMRLKESNGI